jgi:hypothetical protein
VQEEASMSKTESKPPAFGLSYDTWGRLVLIDSEGKRHVGVEPVRLFPMSDPGNWISICDSAGHELVCIEDPGALPAQVREVLAADLAKREFVPVITRIVKVSSEHEPAEWDVETDRGPTRFLLRSEDDVRRLGAHGASIVDAQGIRYVIPDTRVLDSASRRVLEVYV